jgi:predicted dehydrogenase
MPRVAVVGTGFGSRVHVPALRAAGFDVVALVGQDRDRTARRAQRLGVPNGCSGLGEAFTLELDAVTIATPPDKHETLTLEALAAGVHVLCEKPFAVDVEQAERMHAAAASAGLVGLVAHEFRFAPDRALVARLIADGGIGTPRLATLLQLISLVADRSTPVPSWWYDDTRGGGWLLASGSHTVDQVRHWLGDVAQVQSGSLLHRGDDADDSFTAQLTMTSGCAVTLVQSATAWGPPGGVTRVVGDKGSVWIDGDAGVWLADAEHPDGRVMAKAPPVEPSDDPRHRFTHLELGPFTDLCRQFAVAVAGGGTGEAATFADGVATQRVLDDIRAATQSAAKRALGGPSGSSELDPPRLLRS